MGASYIDEAIAELGTELKKRDAEIERLRAALKPFAEMRVWAGDGNDIGGRTDVPDDMDLAEFRISEQSVSIGDVRAARRAVEQQGDGK